jgi:hypothetical protein
MSKKGTEADLVISALLKLDEPTGERQNVLKFIESCYGGLVRDYDFEVALASLKQLTEAEHHALIAYIM